MTRGALLPTGSEPEPHARHQLRVRDGITASARVVGSLMNAY